MEEKSEPKNAEISSEEKSPLSEERTERKGIDGSGSTINSGEDCVMGGNTVVTTTNSPSFGITKVKKTGEGTYGIVYTGQVRDNGMAGLKERPSNPVGRNIAVKRNLIDASTDFIGSLREVHILSHLNGHPFIVRLVDISFGDPFVQNGSSSGMLSPLRSRELKDDSMHFIFEHALFDGHHFLYDHGHTLADIKKGMVQLLISMEYIHAQGIIHRDIKPSNILIFPDETDARQFVFKFCDFGLSKFRTNQGRQSPGTMTSWYRSPEVCLDWPDYSYKADIWSLGCVFYEFLSKRPLLYDVRERNDSIFNSILGLLPTAAPQSTLDKMFKYRRPRLTAAATPARRKTWIDRMNYDRNKIIQFNNNGPGTYSEYLDLLDHMLTLDPDVRWSVSDALNSSFCNHYRDYIQTIRSQFPPKPQVETTLTVSDCVERRWATAIAFTVFNNRNALIWYRHRTLFQAIDIFDRYLTHVVNTSKQSEPGQEVFTLTTSERGQYMSRYDVELRFTVCLYVSIKYFTTLNIPISYSDLTTEDYRSPEAKRTAEQFERHLIKDVLKYRIYRDTVYEIADSYGDILDEKSIRDLLMIYGTLTSFTGLIASDLYRLYRIAIK